jgi:hypothetical protein
MDALRRGRDEAVAERRQRPRPEYPGGPHDDDYRPHDEDDYRPYDDPPPAESEGLQVRIAELESDLRAREAERDEYKGLLSELADAVDQHRARIAELEMALAATEPFASVLQLPGVETWLRTRFHPDKYPDADPEQQRLLNEATKTINAAYTLIRQANAHAKDQSSDSSSA